MSCVVPHCRSTVKSAKKSGEIISFHRFPDDYARQLQWIAGIGRNNWMPSKHHRICSKHFKRECYIIACNKRILMPNAIPTIFGRPCEMPLTPAERQKRYREKLKKENPDKYEAYKKKLAAKALLYYREKVSQYTEEEKKKRRQQRQQRKVTSEKPTSPTKKKIPLTAAERQKRYREKLKKQNPDKYIEYKNKDAARSSLLYYRQKVSQYTDEKKEKRRQQWRDANRNETSPANKQITLTPDGGPKKYRERLEKKNPHKFEENKKKVAENYRCYREKADQYTEDKKEKYRQQCNTSKLSSAEKKIQEERKIEDPEKKEIIKYIEIAKCNKVIAHISQTTLNEVKKQVKKCLTPAERQKRYREKIKKENPDKYVEIKNKAAANARRYYREKLSCNRDTYLIKQWNDVRGKILSPGEKMKRYRERLKRENPAKYADYMKKTAESAKRYYREKAMLYMEEEREERRQKWREARRIYQEKQNKTPKQKQDELQMNGEESLSEDDAQPGPFEPPMTPPWHPNSQSVSDNCQDPLRKPTDQCRFCGEDSKDYLVVSSHMPYLAGNMITLALNDTSVQLDFNDGLPNTICTDCHNKLQEYCDFIKTVKTAQDMLKRKIKSETEDVREAHVFIKTEAPDEEEMNSISISDTVFVKNTVNYKRKGDVTSHKAKFAKNVMVESENEMIFDIKEEVVDYDEHIECSVLSNSGCETSVNVMVESENEIDIKQEMVNNDEDIECSKISDAGSETLSIPDELKYSVVSDIDETLMIRKERTGSATTVNATRKERTGSVTTVNATRKERTGSATTVNATRKERTGSATTVNATRKERTGSATTVNATRKERTGSFTTVNATRKERTGSATTVNATSALSPKLVAGIIRLAQRSATGGP